MGTSDDSEDSSLGKEKYPDQSPNSKSNSNSKSVQAALDQQGLHIDEDSGYVFWNDDNKEYPRNWPQRKKLFNDGIIFWLEFFMTFISTSGTAAADAAREEYGISMVLSYFAFVSVYLIGQTIGGIFCSPISETFGRRTLYIGSSILFCIFNVIIAAVPSVITVFFGRFVTGFVAAIPATVAFGNFDDTHDWETRIWVVYFYTLAGNTGLVLGPIYAAYLVETIGWRWIFYIATIASGFSAALALPMRESRATSLLEAKVEAIKESTGTEDLHVESPKHKFSASAFVQEALLRPLFFLATEPIIIFCAVLCSIAYGLIYGLTASLTIVYEGFGFSTSQTSLAFIPILLGLILNIIPRFYEQHKFTKFRKTNRKILPETKIDSFAVACPALAVGLWLFAWTTPPLVTYIHWIVSMIGLVLIGFAANDFAYLLFGYVTDAYPRYAASAVSSLSLSRTLVAAAFPLFISQMYTGLGANWASSILAGAATLFAFTPILFLGWGARLRDMSSRAVNSDEDL